MKRIAIFASGTGSNARCIHEYSLIDKTFEVACILSNRKNAKVLDYATDHGISNMHFAKSDLTDSDLVLHFLKSQKVDFIVLAGFLLLIPQYLIDAFPMKIINIHPSLLPKHGGKGMYGHHVHEAVRNAKETESGMTIHYVNNEYDKGRFIFQSKVKLRATDTADDIAAKVLQLEHHFYPKVVAGLMRKE